MIRLSAVVGPKTIKPRLGAEGKFPAIQELLELMVTSHDLSMARYGTAREAVFRSERGRASGSKSGAAVVAATVEGLRAPVGALGISEKGIDFGGGTPSKVVLVMLYPTGGFDGQHSLVPSIRERLQKDREVVDALAVSRTAGDVERILQRLD